jgi:sugar phosphate isomerase/epimerase
MKRHLSASNIAWPVDATEQVYTLLSEAGFDGVEVALTKFGTWEQLNEERIRSACARIKAHGLRVSSFQALYFGKPEAQLLAGPDEFDLMLQHTLFVAKMAELMGEQAACVFGAPRNRSKGDLSDVAAFELGAQRLRTLAEEVHPFGLTLVLESAPPAYNGDFLTTIEACADMVYTVDHPALRLHLDMGCASMSGESPVAIVERHAGILHHLHLSRQNLVAFDNSMADDLDKLSSALDEVDYNGYAAIEMRESAQPLADVAMAVDLVRSAFLSQ